jgi:hypothetical protein
VLLAVGFKYNYGMPPGVLATRMQIVAFWQSQASNIVVDATGLEGPF